MTCLAFESSPPGFEGVVALLIKEKLSFSEEEQTQLLFIHDLSDYSENTKKPYVMKSPLGIT